MKNKQAKYVQVMQQIKDEIVNGYRKPGQRISSENELCRDFQVSRQTVRQALGLLEEEGLLERRRGSGTYVHGIPPANRPKSMCVGLISSWLESYIFPQQTRGIERVLSENGYALQLGLNCHKLETEEKLIRSMIAQGVDGILLEPVKSALPGINEDCYNLLERMHMPVILMNTRIPGKDIPCVALDDRKGGYIATQHLIAMGHRSIAGIFNLNDYQGHLRYAGFMDAMRDNGLLCNEDKILWYSSGTHAMLFGGSTDQAILQLFHGCTAVVCFNDEIALDLLELLRRQGIRVPEDMSVMGYDNSSQSARSTPALSTITHPGSHLGEMAAQQLLRLIENPACEAGYLFEPELVTRASVRKL